MILIFCFLNFSINSFALTETVQSFAVNNSEEKLQKTAVCNLNAKRNCNLNNTFITWDSCMPSTARYEVYKSADSGKTWQMIVFKSANEPAQLNGKYTCVDPKPLGVELYKLKVVDSSKHQIMEDLTRVDYSRKYPSVLKSFQSKPKFGNFSFEVDSNTEYAVLNEEGKACKVGEAKGVVVISGLQNGVYYLNIIAQYQVETYKVVIQ